MRHEHTSPRVAEIAARALRDPHDVTPQEVRTLAGSALTQAPGEEEADATEAETREAETSGPTGGVPLTDWGGPAD